MLRGAASVAVVFHHVAQQMLGNELDEHAWGRLLLWLGPWGVYVFFVLSGFCVHHSFLRTAQPRRIEPEWRVYFVRRARRIVPGYVVALLLSAVLGCFGDTILISSARWTDLLTHLTFTSSFSADASVRISSPLWTVVFEVHFYLAYPLFIWCRNRLGIVRLTGLLLVLSLGLQVTGRWWHDENIRWLWHHSFLNLWWIWSMGALLAEQHAGWVGAPRLLRCARLVPALVIIAASLVPGCIDPRHLPFAWNLVPSYGLPFLAAAVVAMVAFSPLAGLRSKIAEHLGLVSYSMYLFHAVALWIVVWWMPALPPFLVLGSMLALSYLLALAGYYLIERPFMRR